LNGNGNSPNISLPHRIGFISALVVFVIILPAVCTACYHYVSFRRGWDADDDPYNAGWLAWLALSPPFNRPHSPTNPLSDLESSSDDDKKVDGVAPYETTEGEEKLR